MASMLVQVDKALGKPSLHLPRAIFEDESSRFGNEMAVEWSLEADGTVVWLRTGAQFSSSDLMNALRAASEHADAQWPLAVIFDNRGSRESAPHDVLVERVRSFAEHGDRFGPAVAVVVDDPLHFGLARIGSAYAEELGISVQVFRDLDSARAWLRQTTKGWRPE